MKKFEVGQMVRVVRFDVSDAGRCVEAFMPGEIENGRFEVVAIYGSADDWKNSISVRLNGKKAGGKAYIDNYIWCFPACCLLLVEQQDSFKSRASEAKIKRRGGL